MDRTITLGVTLIAGAALGAAAISGLQAQAKAPGAYAIVEVSEIVDADLLKQLLPKTGPAVKAGGGQFLARSDKITPLVGDPPKRFVIIAFDSVAQAKDWHRSPAQQEVNAMVEKAERVRSFIVDSAM
jgi:uncharacterized protein (DUF1330 family)